MHVVEAQDQVKEYFDIIYIRTKMCISQCGFIAYPEIVHVYPYMVHKRTHEAQEWTMIKLRHVLQDCQTKKTGAVSHDESRANTWKPEEY